MAQPSTSQAKKSTEQKEVVLTPEEDEKILLRAFKEAKEQGLSEADRMKLFTEMRAEIINEKLIAKNKEVTESIESLSGLSKKSELDALKIPKSEDIMNAIELPKFNVSPAVTTAERKTNDSQDASEERTNQVQATNSNSTKAKVEIESKIAGDTHTNVESIQETKISIVSEKNISLSLKSNTHGHYRRINADVKLSSDGTISVVEKSQSGTSKDLSKNFTTLYLGDDNKLRDSEGTIVSKIGSGSGKLASSYLPNLITNRSAANNSILEVAENTLNNFSHEDKQVIFIKGKPPEKIGDDKSTESKTIESKVAKSKVTEEKVDVDKSTTTTDNKSRETNIDRKIHPYKMHIYDVKINGTWHQKKAYLRINNTAGDNKLEIFTGKDSQGKDVWVDAKKVNTPAFTMIKVDQNTGNFTREDGSKIDRFQKLDSTSLSSEVVKGLVEKSSTGLKSIKESHINDLFIDGKRPIFF